MRSFGHVPVLLTDSRPGRAPPTSQLAGGTLPRGGPPIMFMTA